jgi:hypothetical protein
MLGDNFFQFSLLNDCPFKCMKGFFCHNITSS